MINLRISLSAKEADALAKLAYSELRDPQDQLRYLLRRELKRRNLLPFTSEANKGPARESEANDIRK